MTYPENEGHCRIPDGNVDVEVEVQPAGGGEFVPVRLVFTNHYALVRMSVILKLNPPHTDGSEREAKVAYVCDSAVFNHGELESVEIKVDEDELVRFDLVGDTGGLPGVVVLDLLLLGAGGPAEDARFEVSVWAPCESTPEEVGCHMDHPAYRVELPWSSQDWRLQRVASAVRMDLLGATYDDSDERLGMLQSPVLGCQCGGGEGGGVFCLLIGILAALTGGAARRQYL
jgi:hypothetical protein